MDRIEYQNTVVTISNYATKALKETLERYGELGFELVNVVMAKNQYNVDAMYLFFTKINEVKTMAEYIEREAFIKILKETKNDCEHYADKVCCDFAIRMVNLMPTADVQEVVRCKDCRWRSTEECAMYYRCNCGEQYTWECDNDFCSYGEKMDKEGLKNDRD